MKQAPKTVSIHTLGCRVNIAETATIKQGFADRGYHFVPFGERSDIVVINTCTVTDKADATCRNIIRKAVNSSPNGKVVVVGCLVQVEADTVKQMEGVNLVLGTQEKHKLFDYLDQASLAVNTNEDSEFIGAYTTKSDGHTRAFLKIQDGCNYFCSYCIIPHARGRFRSSTVDQAVKNLTDLTEQGFKEVVLTGINIGEFRDSDNCGIDSLVSNLTQVEKLKRLRLSSIEPNLITDSLLAALADSGKCMDHFHIPLQSGDDMILKAMNRRYTTAQYLESIERIKRYFPGATIGADVITGFPGEDEASFKRTYDFIKSSPITHFHVFPYSERKGTRASSFDNQVDSAIRKKRCKELIQLGDQKLNEFSQNFVGSTTEVLFEKRNKEGFFAGYSTNYLRVRLESEENLSNQIRSVKVTSFENGKLRGEEEGSGAQTPL